MHTADKVFYPLLLFVPITFIGEYFGASSVLLFFLSALAIISLAKFIGEATEELSVYTGTALGGLLNATFGNATELIISFFALQAGLIEVVKASITGSVLANLLLVLGMAMFFGGLKHTVQKFNVTAAKTSSSTLLLGLAALIIPAIFLQTSNMVGTGTIQDLSVIVAVFLIIAYGAGLIFSLWTHKHLYIQEVGKLTPNWSKWKSITILLLATIFVAFMSEILVGSIEPLVAHFGWSELFIGVVVIAILGNAAEHASAVTVAIKNKMDLAFQISIGSAIQIIMFVAPVLVLVSLFFTHQMSLVFNAFELVALILSVIIVNAIVEDGESNWLEGLQLLICYMVDAADFFLHP